MTRLTKASPTERTAPRFLWLDLTRKCQLGCRHCYNASGPDGRHGTMAREDWICVLDQAADCGVRGVQFIGGEPTMHPHARELVGYALALGLQVEVFSNLVHVTPEWWTLLRREGISLATSYYSDQAAEHDAVTGRRSHHRTRANIEHAVRLGIPLRAGIIASDETQRIGEAQQELQALGVTMISVDRVRPFGRGADGRAPATSGLCGRCGTGRAVVGPDGTVAPCVFSDWMGVGNIRDGSLADILGGVSMAEANARIRSTAKGGACGPDQECTPGFPGSSCNPRN
ncbi:radical SAM protein [Streptomyces armeniacus]|uniref:Radical SAM protein n=1 Tax=Streptomyces armeniacus TaxID=83291 RepID=A0A345XV34_9ACTN|nr:radical SAM protein [Streptomyces armeniacus]AXK35500.1 radical SAM protein [Streptomyces armeniacus]